MVAMNAKLKKIRLDDLLVERGDFPDRAAALRAVMAREVRVDDVYATSAAIKVSPAADIFIRGRKQFVSRGGKKLQGALDAFRQRVDGMNCLDIGSSTGGFTDCMLQNGAEKVYAVEEPGCRFGGRKLQKRILRRFKHITATPGQQHRRQGDPQPQLQAAAVLFGLRRLPKCFIHGHTSFVYVL